MTKLVDRAPTVFDTVGSLLEHRRGLDPDGVGLEFPRHGSRLTYAEWDAASTALARALLDLGLERGDRVALLAENRIEWQIISVAVARAGLILVPVNTHSRSDDLHHALHQSGSRMVLLPEAFRSNAFLEILDGLRDRLPDLEHTVVIAPSAGSPWPSLDSLIEAGARSTTALPEVRGDDPGVIIYTSGTTGKPKGVVMRHAAVIANGRLVFDRLGIDGDDVVTSIVPMFHSGAFCVALPGCLTVGARYVGIDAFDAVEMMEIIQSHRATVHTAVPATLRAMLNHPRRPEFDLSSLRVGTVGGADADPALLAACIEQLPFPGLVQGYGLTEAGTLVTCAAPVPGRDLTTAGPPLPGFEVRIAAVDSGDILPVGVTGEIHVKSDYRMIEYFGLPEATVSTFTADGWLKTGDLGELTEAGEIRMTGGRLKDMIIRGGENVYPAEIENTLVQHPLVLEAAVFGIPDKEVEEIVGAAVTCSGEVSAAELTAFCAERIARFKVPAVYFAVDEWPLTPSGKIRKTVLRERVAAGGLPKLP